jgi:hypothetical protein
MEHELECPKCNYKFFISEDYQVGDCPNCGKAHYCWDYVLDEETYEEFFSGYYWENNE